MDDSIVMTPRQKERKPWQDSGNMALGLWLMIAPGVLEFASTGPASMSCVVLGIGLIGMVGWTMFYPRAWKEAVIALIGGLLIGAPWALGFAAEAAPMWNAVAIGAVVLMLAGMRLLTLTGHGGHGLPAAS